MALSGDLRERLVAAVNGGQSCRAAGERFGVSAASAVRWMQRVRATGSFAASRLAAILAPIALNAKRISSWRRWRQNPTSRPQRFGPTAAA
jgi:transposase